MNPVPQLLRKHFRRPLLVPVISTANNSEISDVMEADAEHFGWEEMYRLLGVFEEDDDEQPSRGEKGRGPTPLTQFPFLLAFCASESAK